MASDNLNSGHFGYTQIILFFPNLENNHTLNLHALYLSFTFSQGGELNFSKKVS